ncbi:Mellein synthase [Pseudocercospora fuligena]|uniref:Mellein synthase n=1 Tax=Pseudocercospora fuligena TaxID=685502 RepID=A0A8H6R6T3_9PEZI|nr:Mellein synthase [Pseudocercospora fuligena]
MYQSELHVGDQPFPQPHMLHGTNILPAAVHVCTLLQAAETGCSTLSRISLKVPLSITEDPRIVQVVRERDYVKILSRPAKSADLAWVVHSAASLADDPSTLYNSGEAFDIASIKERIGTTVQSDFATNALKDVGVEGMAFPWQVRSHYSNGAEMLVEVDSDSSREIMAWDHNSWAPMLDAATSISFSLLADDPKLRIVSSIESVTIRSGAQPPKAFYLFITEVPAQDEHTRATNVAILDMHGVVVADVKGVALTEVHGASGIHSSRSIEKLVHHVAWVPAKFSERLRDFAQAIVVSSNDELRERRTQQLRKQISNVDEARTVKDIQVQTIVDGNIAIIYCPPQAAQLDDIAAYAHQGLCDTVEIIRFAVENKLPAKVFVITDGVSAADSPAALAQGPLYGLARVAASEHPDVWGGLIDSNGPDFPSVPFRYVHGQDIIRFVEGLPWVARLRPMTADQRAISSEKTLLPKPDGTYIVTGGFGDLGLETCDFLIEKGARRLVLVSRRTLPPRRDWPSASSSWTGILGRIQAMEKQGASIHTISLDIGAEDAHERLPDALRNLSLPPVRGVVHAAGVVEDGLLFNTSAESFERVLSPKLSGALTLRRAFPPGELDFFVLFSSVGQLVGLQGQSSYASANAFLDCLADHRRQQGDNAVAFLWTAWRKLGMGASDLVLLECHGRGISDIERDERFAAWEYMERYDVSQCVVSPTLVYGKDESVPAAILEDVVERRQASDDASSGLEAAGNDSISELPADASELRSWVDLKIRECVATVMKFDDADEIDSRLALSEIGVDSVVSIPLRQRLQDTFKTKVPQTIVWNYPTVESQVEWFAKQIAE